MRRCADSPDEDRTVCAAGSKDNTIGAAMIHALLAEDGGGCAREDADGPDSVGVPIKRGFWVYPSSFPNPYCRILAARKNPTITECSASI